MARIPIRLSTGFVALAISLGAASYIQNNAVAAGAGISVPTPLVDPAIQAKQAVAVFAGGCFWGVQGVYQHVKGVRSAVSGYSGGTQATAHYEEVGTGQTGHAEAVRVTYDPAQVSYGTLLRIYFSVVADPTTPNYQGPDHGPQYRSAIFPTTPQQQVVAVRYIAQLGKSGIWRGPIVTKVEPFRGFYPAEGYHQNYLTLNPDAPYIRINDLPKVTALRQQFPNLYRVNAVLVRL